MDLFAAVSNYSAHWFRFGNWGMLSA